MLQKRLFDIIVSLILITVTIPIMVIISVFVYVDLGRILFKQERIGQFGIPFYVYKFPTRKKGSTYEEQEVDFNNSRLTSLGARLRKYKLDELPQLFQVLGGKMSIIGPRPELPTYIKYHEELRNELLQYKTGLIDLAVIHYLDEDEVLRFKENPREYYCTHLLRKKINLSLETQRYQLKTWALIFRRTKII